MGGNSGYQFLVLSFDVSFTDSDPIAKLAGLPKEDCITESGKLKLYSNVSVKHYFLSSLYF